TPEPAHRHTPRSGTHPAAGGRSADTEHTGPDRWPPLARQSGKVLACSLFISLGMDSAGADRLVARVPLLRLRDQRSERRHAPSPHDPARVFVYFGLVEASGRDLLVLGDQPRLGETVAVECGAL